MNKNLSFRSFNLLKITYRQSIFETFRSKDNIFIALCELSSTMQRIPSINELILKNEYIFQVKDRYNDEKTEVITNDFNPVGR